MLFTAAMVGRGDRGFIFNLDIQGTDPAAASELVRRFLQEIRWQG